MFVSMSIEENAWLAFLSGFQHEGWREWRRRRTGWRSFTWREVLFALHTAVQRWERQTALINGCFQLMFDRRIIDQRLLTRCQFSEHIEPKTIEEKWNENPRRTRQRSSLSLIHLNCFELIDVCIRVCIYGCEITEETKTKNGCVFAAAWLYIHAPLERTKHSSMHTVSCVWFDNISMCVPKTTIEKHVTQRSNSSTRARRERERGDKNRISRARTYLLKWFGFTFSFVCSSMMIYTRDKSRKVTRDEMYVS